MDKINVCPKCGSTGVGMSGSGNRDYECLECGYADKAKEKKTKNCE
jgi:ribosomal protein S27AE